MTSLLRMLPKTNIPKAVALENPYLALLQCCFYLPVIALGVFQFWGSKQYSKQIPNAASLSAEWAVSGTGRTRFVRDDFNEVYGIDDEMCRHTSDCFGKTESDPYCKANEAIMFPVDINPGDIVQLRHTLQCSRLCETPEDLELYEGQCWHPALMVSTFGSRILQMPLFSQESAYTRLERGSVRSTALVQSLAALIEFHYTFKLASPPPWFFGTEKAVNAGGSEKTSYTVLVNSNNEVVRTLKPGEAIQAEVLEVMKMAGEANFMAAPTVASTVNCYTDSGDFPSLDAGEFALPVASDVTPVCFIFFGIQAVYQSTWSLASSWKTPFDEGWTVGPKRQTTKFDLWLLVGNLSLFNDIYDETSCKEAVASAKGIPASQVEFKNTQSFLYLSYSFDSDVMESTVLAAVSAVVALPLDKLLVSMPSARQADVSIIMEDPETLPTLVFKSTDTTLLGSALASQGAAVAPAVLKQPQTYINISMHLFSELGAVEAVLPLQSAELSSISSTLSQQLGQPVVASQLSVAKELVDWITFQLSVTGVFRLECTSGNSFHRLPDVSACLLNLISLLVLMSLPGKFVTFIASNFLGKLSKVYKTIACEPFSLPKQMAATMLSLAFQRQVFDNVAKPALSEKQISRDQLKALLNEMTEAETSDAVVDFCFKICSKDGDVLDFRKVADMLCIDKQCNPSLMWELLDPGRKQSCLEKLLFPPRLKSVLRGRAEEMANMTTPTKPASHILLDEDALKVVAPMHGQTDHHHHIASPSKQHMQDEVAHLAERMARLEAQRAEEVERLTARVALMEQELQAYRRGETSQLSNTPRYRNFESSLRSLERSQQRTNQSVEVLAHHLARNDRGHAAAFSYLTGEPTLLEAPEAPVLQDSSGSSAQISYRHANTTGPF